MPVPGESRDERKGLLDMTIVPATLENSTGGGAVPQPSVAVPFEQLLSSDLRWAMSEGSLFFEGEGKVQKSLQRIARRLDELGIPYAVAGGMALFAHGYQRFTDDIDILMTRDDLARMHEALDGRGWIRPFSTSKNLRDAQTGVRIEFLISGGYPGDGKPKPVTFPAPADVAVEMGGIKYLGLPAFIELKLASGMSGQNREKDFVDVNELIRTLQLSESFASSLNPFVREKYLALWRKANVSLTRFIVDRSVAGTRVEEMLADGVMLEGELSDPMARLVTTDPVIAKKYGMEDETESL
jgi:hypothetical protein